MKEVKKPIFNTKERAILQVINKSRRGLTIYEISRKTGIAWVTVKKYIKLLIDKKLIIEIKEKNAKTKS